MPKNIAATGNILVTEMENTNLVISRLRFSPIVAPENEKITMTLKEVFGLREILNLYCERKVNNLTEGR